jgi:hypothetical protein
MCICSLHFHQVQRLKSPNFHMCHELAHKIWLNDHRVQLLSFWVIPLVQAISRTMVQIQACTSTWSRHERLKMS